MLSTYLENRDITGLWEHLATFDLSLNGVYTLKLVQELALESYRPTDIVETYSQRLLSYQLKLQSSKYPIDDPQLVLKLCIGMPNTSNWDSIMQSVLREDYTFKEAVTQFQAAERLQTSTSKTDETNTANFAKDGSKSKRDGRYKGKKTGWRKSKNKKNASNDASSDREESI
jgi:hypothetical protein